VIQRNINYYSNWYIAVYALYKTESAFNSMEYYRIEALKAKRETEREKEKARAGAG
jgi:hypothetical protein